MNTYLGNGETERGVIPPLLLPPLLLKLKQQYAGRAGLSKAKRKVAQAKHALKQPKWMPSLTDSNWARSPKLLKTR